MTPIANTISLLLYLSVRKYIGILKLMIKQEHLHVHACFSRNLTYTIHICRWLCIYPCYRGLKRFVCCTLGAGQGGTRKGPKIRPNRMKVSSNIPTEEELAAIKHRKKVRAN